MESQKSTEPTSSSTDRGVRGEPSGRRRSRSLANMLQNINQEELEDGISKKKPKPKLPMELALENDVVLLEIFHHSSPSDLKRFRLVNRKWNDTATSTLLIRKSLELKLSDFRKYGRGSDEFMSDPGTSASSLSSQDEFANGSHRSMTGLCRLIESSAKFPTKSLKFTHNYAEPQPQVRQLLKIFGHQVKELTFDYQCQISIYFLRELLLDLVPNLESLTLRSCTLVEEKRPLSTTDQDGDNSFDCDPIHSLPHLTQLAFLPNRLSWDELNSDYLLQLELFRELMDAAVNLSSIYTFPLDFLEVLLDSGKLQLVKKLTLEPTREFEERLGGGVEVSAAAIYQKFTSMKPEIKMLKIQCLDFDDYFVPSHFEKSMLEGAINSILESSKDSLRGFRLEMQPGFSIDVPVLPNLKQLKIGVQREQGSFSAGLSTHNPTFSFQRNFPHLHEFHLHLPSYMDIDLKDKFDGNLEKWVSPTVKHLKLDGNLSYQGEGEIDSPYEGPQMLGKMFPNATSVVIVYAQRFYAEQQLSSIIWYQIPAGVKRLSVTNVEVREPFQDVVDTFFTGIPIKICRTLRKLPQRICEEKHVLDAFRTEPSICVFKCLEELNIFCKDLQSDHPFASHVTGLYAFDLMPQLKVTVTYKPEIWLTGSRENITPSEDMNRSLKHIAPYITQVCHEKSYYKY